MDFLEAIAAHLEAVELAGGNTGWHLATSHEPPALQSGQGRTEVPNQCVTLYEYSLGPVSRWLGYRGLQVVARGDEQDELGARTKLEEIKAELNNDTPRVLGGFPTRGTRAQAAGPVLLNGRNSNGCPRFTWSFRVACSA